MADPQAAEDREQARRWVDTWREAGLALDELRRREIQAADPREAITPNHIGLGRARGLVRPTAPMTPLFEAAFELENFFPQRGCPDRAYIETQLSPLAQVKGQPEIMDACRKLPRT